MSNLQEHDEQNNDIYLPTHSLTYTRWHD